MNLLSQMVVMFGELVDWKLVCACCGHRPLTKKKHITISLASLGACTFTYIGNKKVTVRGTLVPSVACDFLLTASVLLWPVFDPPALPTKPI